MYMYDVEEYSDEPCQIPHLGQDSEGEFNGQFSRCQNITGLVYQRRSLRTFSSKIHVHCTTSKNILMNLVKFDTWHLSHDSEEEFNGRFSRCQNITGSVYQRRHLRTIYSKHDVEEFHYQRCQMLYSGPETENSGPFQQMTIDQPDHEDWWFLGNGVTDSIGYADRLWKRRKDVTRLINRISPDGSTIQFH